MQVRLTVDDDGVSWSVTSDIGEFVATAGSLMRARPVDNTVLLTEAAYLAARPTADADQLYGWWRSARGAVTGAFVQAPRHPPVLSVLSADAHDALASLVDVLPPASSLGVDGRSVDAVTSAWRDAAGVVLAERSRIRLYRLGRLNAPSAQAGRARVATKADRVLLVSWFERLMAEHPDDPSDLAYVVDDPIGYGGITLWEVDGVPVAMAGRSRLVAGMVRLSAVWAAFDGGAGDDLSSQRAAFEEAVFVAAAASAQQVARDVLMFAGAADEAGDAAHRRLGFTPVLDRVMLGPAEA